LQPGESVLPEKIRDFQVVFINLTNLNYSQMDMCGAACEAVAIHREQAATMQIHLPLRGEKGR